MALAAGMGASQPGNARTRAQLDRVIAERLREAAAAEPHAVKGRNVCRNHQISIETRILEETDTSVRSMNS